jgi:hypothetical protein
MDCALSQKSHHSTDTKEATKKAPNARKETISIMAMVRGGKEATAENEG